MKREDFFYEDEEGVDIPLNWDLADRQECTDIDRQMIILDHNLRVAIFKEMAIVPVGDVETLRKLALRVERAEYELQSHWHFELDKNYHTFWYKVPHCRCPKMDNADSMYFGRRIVVEGCPIHWTSPVTKKPTVWQRIKRMIGAVPKKSRK